MSNYTPGQLRAIADKEIIRRRVRRFLAGEQTAWGRIKLALGSYAIGFRAPSLFTKAGRDYMEEISRYIK